MAEQTNEGNGWLRKIAGIFVELEPETDTSTGSTSGTPSNVPVTPRTSPATSTSQPKATPSASSGDFMEDLKNRFRKVLEEKNQAGFDFYEFSMMLLRSSNNPTSDHFKTAFEGAKIMNPTCNQQFLISSASFYKTELQSAFEATVKAGQQKKEVLNTEKANEQKQLNADIASLEQQLAKLREEIAKVEKTKLEKTTALQSIDARFDDKVTEIQQKIDATVSAKDSILNEIVLIENGIKNYL